ncbi:zona pellucida sperm-binding protein 4-like [Sebastes umbrosus]|uniref:zona pellucida sperm-binding protein 4-like n=1 Tax=Sebastes umbrosus TaxID=72105 RepID=UPI00189EDA71|nr:zona pellucida sperm-binding protein 4-like [Sebastes umbrosus]
MAKHRSVSALVALALLWCLVGTEVEAQDSWQKPAAPSMSKGAPPRQAPQVLPRPQVPQALPYPEAPQVLPRPQWPQALPYPEAPQVLPRPQVPQALPYPEAPQVLPRPQAPKVLPRPQVPQALPRPQVPQALPYPEAPQVLPRPQWPQALPYPEAPQVLPRPQAPQVLPRPQAPQVLPRPQVPQALPRPQAPQVLPRPQVPQALPHPQAPQVLPRPQVPQALPYPQAPQVLPRPQVPQVLPHPQVPHALPYPQSPQVLSRPQAPQQSSFRSCEVIERQKIPCGGSDISAAACEAISCCFDGQRCYFGKAVTVQCTKDGQFIVVVARDATLPNIDLESIVLMGQGDGCTHVDSNSDFAIYNFPVTACGSVVMEEPGVIIYENRMTCSYEVGVGPLGIITRDSQYQLLFQCRYFGTSVETVVVEVLSLSDSPPIAALGPIRVHLRLANGQCNTKGCNEVDAAYSSFYTEADYPVSKVLRDPVYVEVQLSGKTDPNLVLTLGRCWTTTSPNPHSLPQWDILTDGCPYRDDRYLSSLVTIGSSSGLDFPGHCRRFLFKMFTFVDPSSMGHQSQQVYIHCSTAVCSAAAGQSCEPSCLRRRKRDAKAADQKAEPRVVASVGPVIMSPEQ